MDQWYQCTLVAIKWILAGKMRAAVHSHPSAVVYVLKGGRVKYTMPDGTTKISELKTGEALIRPPVTHSDEALDDVEAILIEIKQ
jgi:quercetin dioxygenase-like cupin family protein